MDGDPVEYCWSACDGSRPGIDADEHERIFERFCRGRHATDTRARGSGIGLSLVKHIAESHGGRVQVTSPWTHSRGERLRDPHPYCDLRPTERPARYALGARPELLGVKTGSTQTALPLCSLSREAASLAKERRALARADIATTRSQSQAAPRGAKCVISPPISTTTTRLGKLG